MEKELEDILSKIDRQASNYHRRVINYCKEYKTNPSNKKEKLIRDCLYAEQYCKNKRKLIVNLYPVYIMVSLFYSDPDVQRHLFVL